MTETPVHMVATHLCLPVVKAIYKYMNNISV